MAAEAAAQQGCKKLVALPHGHFEVLFNNSEKNYQVAVYKFRNVVGCRSTQSAQHGHLPVVSPHHREIALTRDTEKIRVGFQYLYGYEHNYRIEEGKVILSQQVPMEPLNPLHENQRTVAMITSFVSALGNEYKLQISSGKETSHYSPFSGGGDIQQSQFFSSGCTEYVGRRRRRNSTARHTPPPSPPKPLLRQQYDASQTGGVQVRVDKK